MKRLPLTALVLTTLACHTMAEVSLPNIFGSHMVMQREQSNPVWGKAEPGEVVAVTFAGKTFEATAGDDGKWRVTLDPLEAGGPHEMVIEGNNRIVFEDVLMGEVWFCSGQSNMQTPVKKAYNAEVEIASANYPEIRLLYVPNVGTQTPQENFKGSWLVCSPDTVADYSAVGYFFCRRIHNTLGVPVGLVNNAWGGSDAEAWLPREVLEQYPRYEHYIQNSDEKCAAYSDEIHEQVIAEWEAADPNTRSKWRPSDPRYNQKRPANIYNGVLYPTIGYGMRGVIWYQGESNLGRHKDYKHLMTILIETMREQWGQGDFPFYWVQLADFWKENDQIEDSPWAYLRESQTALLDTLPGNTGQAVIIDIGEGRDIHPRNKQFVANRLARHALAKDYGYPIHAESPRFKDMKIEGNTVTLTFDHVSDGGLYAFDTEELRGFAIAGEDKQFVWAKAEILGKTQVKVWADGVENPAAVRYAWAYNPVCNLYDKNGLPATPFRTDEW